MDLSIISRVTEIINEKKSNILIPDKRNTERGDTVEISAVGNEVKRLSDFILTQDETAREARVQEIKQQVSLVQYHLNEEMIDMIAERIANLYV